MMRLTSVSYTHLLHWLAALTEETLENSKMETSQYNLVLYGLKEPDMQSPRKPLDSPLADLLIATLPQADEDLH